MNRLRRFGAKYGHYFGIMGALLAFGSWIVSNTVSDGAKSRKEDIRVALSDMRQYATFVSLSRQSELIEGMIRIDSQLVFPRGDPLTNFVPTGVMLRYSEYFNEAISNLRKLAEEESGFSESVHAQPSITNKLAGIQHKISELETNYHKAHSSFASVKADLGTRVRAIQSKDVNEYFLDQATNAAIFVLAVFGPGTNSFQKECGELQDEATSFFSELREAAIHSSKIADVEVTVTRYAAFCLYFIGAGIAIWGKVIEKKTSDNDDNDFSDENG